MSGICGLVDFEGPVDAALLNVMVKGLRFRGPDDEGVLHQPAVAFGHALLRTTAEPANDRQPCEIGGAWITADASLDDRRTLLRQLTAANRVVDPRIPDAQLILHAWHAWGEACVDRLFGDFSFAIWDGRQRRLFCARDHFGARPFFYSRTRTGLVFSNTLQVMRSHPEIQSALDEVFIADFLCFAQSRDLERSAFRDIRRLPPAHCLSLSGAGLAVRRYWSLPVEPMRTVKTAECLEEFGAAFTEAVADCLRLPKSVLWLSGGLDSTAIGVAARKMGGGTEVAAITASWQELFDDPEPAWAAQNAHALGLPHHFHMNRGKPFDHPKDGCSPEPDEDPFRTNSIALLSESAALSRVVLNGQGGDEVLYRELATDVLASAGVRHTVRHLRSSIVGHQRRPALGLRAILARRRGPDASAFEIPPWIDPDLRRRMHLDDRSHALNEARKAAIHPTRPGAYRRITAEALWMRYLESLDPGFTRVPVVFRHPFLDLRLVRLLFALPAFPWFIDKYLLRQWLARDIDPALLRRPKVPLAADPILAGVRRHGAEWLSGVQWSRRLEGYVCVKEARKRLDAAVASCDARLSSWVDLRPVMLGQWMDAANLS